MSIRSLLFVPGNRPERFEKALAAGASAVVIDLEDAVPVAQKAEARATVCAYLKGYRGALRLGVRVNSVFSADGVRDLAALSDIGRPPHILMLPKVRGADEIQISVEALGISKLSVVPIVESALGLRNCWEIAAAGGVEAVLFGAIDLAADIGGEPSWEAMLFARSRLAAACAAANGQLLDVPSIDINDDAGLRETTLKARALGFTGRACIHPRQVPVVNAAFQPSEAEVAQARRVIKALDDAKGAAVQLDGKMVELPVIRSAHRVLAAIGEK
jgi:citrate lyase subunit beta/citryl-CoA lyase/(S)-citramalyl-CoA lyase